MHIKPVWMKMDQTELGLIRDYLVEDIYEMQRQAYLIYMTDLAQLLNKKELTDDQKKEVKDVLEFERQLAKIDFKTYFTRALKDYKLFTENDNIMVLEVEYYDNLGDLFKKTPKRTIANYINFQFCLLFILDLSKEFRQIHQNYMKVLIGMQSEKARWKYCVEYTNHNLDKIVGKLYVDEYFPPESKIKANTMIDDIKDIFNSILMKNEWMEPSTKEYAIKKLAAMIKRIGYPDMYNDSTYLEKEYNNLMISKNNHFLNVINLKHFESNKKWSNVLKPVDKSEWSISPAMINAMHSIIDNSLYFPAAILQPPVFDSDHPRSLNYGAAGMFIGHELTHGFDTEGKQFGITGNLLDWWTPSSMQHFQEKSKCIIDQYHNFEVPEVNLTLNGENTVSENIADNGGLKQAYMAFKQAEKKIGTDPLLPGLNFNPDQLFFLSFANMWCALYREEMLIIQVLSDTHSPNKYRVYGSLANSEEFLTAFNCSKDDKMANKNRCQVW